MPSCVITTIEESDDEDVEVIDSEASMGNGSEASTGTVDGKIAAPSLPASTGAMPIDHTVLPEKKNDDPVATGETEATVLPVTPKPAKKKRSKKKKEGTSKDPTATTTDAAIPAPTATKRKKKMPVPTSNQATLGSFFSGVKKPTGNQLTLGSFFSGVKKPPTTELKKPASPQIKRTPPEEESKDNEPSMENQVPPKKKKKRATPAKSCRPTDQVEATPVTVVAPPKQPKQPRKNAPKEDSRPAPTKEEMKAIVLGPMFHAASLQDNDDDVEVDLFHLEVCESSGSLLPSIVSPSPSMMRKKLALQQKNRDSTSAGNAFLTKLEKAKEADPTLSKQDSKETKSAVLETSTNQVESVKTSLASDQSLPHENEETHTESVAHTSEDEPSQKDSNTTADTDMSSSTEAGKERIETFTATSLESNKEVSDVIELKEDSPLSHDKMDVEKIETSKTSMEASSCTNFVGVQEEREVVTASKEPVESNKSVLDVSTPKESDSSPSQGMDVEMTKNNNTSMEDMSPLLQKDTVEGIVENAPAKSIASFFGTQTKSPKATPKKAVQTKSKYSKKQDSKVILDSIHIADIKKSPSASPKERVQVKAKKQSLKQSSKVIVDSVETSIKNNVPPASSKKVARTKAKLSKKKNLKVTADLVTATDNVPVVDIASQNAVEPNADIVTVGETSEASLANQTPVTAKKTAIIDPPKAPVALSKETKATLAKHETLRSRYLRRSKELIQRGNNGLEEESFKLPKLTEVGVQETDSGTIPEEEFPHQLVRSLALLIQGNTLALSALSAECLDALQKTEHVASKCLTADAVSSKIKLIASRDSYVATPLPMPGSAKVDIYEDTNGNNVWRWELVALDLLPADYIAQVRKARLSRQKLRKQLRAISKFVLCIDNADKLMLTSSFKKDSLDAALAKMSGEEEKVLKYEREEEKARMAEEIKAQNEQARLEKLKKKQIEKERAVAEKLKEKEEREKKKQDLSKQTYEAKRKKDKAEEKRRLDLEEKAEKAKKQRAMMMSFLVTPKPADQPPATSLSRGILPATETLVSSGNQTDSAKTSDSVKKAKYFNSETFRSLINSEIVPRTEPLFPELSVKAKSSRKRRTRKITVSVFTAGVQTNAFSEQPYAEEKEIQVPNKYKFLLFSDDFRPPYRGTWSKPKSTIVTGKNPFGKDTKFLDYDVDSEAEWEDGDDEQGEDCDDDKSDEEEDVADEEGDSRMYNYQDGWMAQDDDIGLDDDEDDDEETKALRKKKLQGMNGPNSNAQPAITPCVIAPRMSGLPQTCSEHASSSAISKVHLDGINSDEAKQLMMTHKGYELSSADGLCLDAFPPPLVDETEPKPSQGESGSSGAHEKVVSQEDLKTLAEFVHSSTVSSREKLVEEIRKNYQNATSSRAQATRTIDSIAVKKRIPNGGGVIWEVNKDVLESVGLGEMAKKPLISPEVAKKAVVEKKKKTVKKKTKLSPSKPVTTVKKKVKEQPSNAVTTTPPPQSSIVSSPDDTDCQKNRGPSGERGKKRTGAPEYSKASVNLFANFLKKQKVTK